MKLLSVRTLREADLSHLSQTRESLTARRQWRRELLSAFDVYKQNVLYGIDEESPEKHGTVLAWYHALLELEPWALAEVPTEVVAYLKGGDGRA